MDKILCWLGFHNWGEMQYEHDHDISTIHNFKCCGKCGRLRAYVREQDG